MDENTRREDVVSTSVHNRKGAPPVYVTREKGAPGFSGRSTRTIHASCARQRSGGKVGQNKQIRG